MNIHTKPEATLAIVLDIIAGADLSPTRRRDMVSAIRRICEMAGSTPAALPADPPFLREAIAKIRPAAHGISAKSWATMRSAFSAALQLAGVIDDLGRGRALKDPAWGPLMAAVAHDKRLSNGLAAFANWCVLQDLSPNAVDDAAVQRFLTWLERCTLHPKPRDLVRRVPKIWNEARATVNIWPNTTLSPLSFRKPHKRLQWENLPDSLRRETEAYLAMRAEPDIFDEDVKSPTRPLAASTIRLQRDYIRLAASVLIEGGEPVETMGSLADLVTAERFKEVLRYYHNQADRRVNAFIIGLAQTLIQIARYHLGLAPEEIDRLKRLAAKLPPVPLDLTPKNKGLIRQLESQRLRAKLLFLPDELLREVARDLERGRGRLPFVKAQAAIAIDILLAVPLRPQNLSSLDWARHFYEPDGPKGPLVMRIPKEETKSKMYEIVARIPDEVARRLRWYRRTMLPRLNADPTGALFVTEKGRPKGQDTITDQIIKILGVRVGLHMTPHQFRHFGATSYLAVHPRDFETVKQTLGHASSKSTRIYTGVASQRALGAYNETLFEQREALKLKRASKERRG